MQAQIYDFDFVMNELKTNSIHKKYPYSHLIKTNNKTINMSLGRIFFNECLPKDYPLVDEPINQSKLDSLMKDIVDKYPQDLLITLFADLQRQFYQISTISPSTFTIDVFLPSNIWMKKKKEFEKVAINYDPTQFQKEAQILTKELVSEIETKGYRIHNILKGGIKGNPIDDWKNLLVGKGYVIDIEGNLLGPIVHGVTEGLTKQEYFDSIAEARRGFYYKASLTAIPGYLTRKLIMSSANITLTNKDCKSKKYLEIFINKDNINNLTGRYMYIGNELIETTLENLKPYIGKKIKIRSPLFCMSKNNQICQVCFGTIATKLNTDKIGILAAGVINQVTINQLMKMRHKSSQLDAVEVNFPKIIKESSINITELEELVRIEKNKIYAKVPVTIYIELDDYNDLDIIETESTYQLPGFLQIQSTEDSNLNVYFPFDFILSLHKAKDFSEIRKVVEFSYVPGELIISQDYIIEQTDPNIIRRLFDAGYKYLKTVEALTSVIAKKLPTMDLVYIETMVQNMYRSKTNLQNNCRLTHYKNCVVKSQKQLPFLNSWINSLTFENIDKGIKKALLTNQDIRYDPIENIVIEKFN
jgi:hypothetical protein